MTWAGWFDIGGFELTDTQTNASGHQPTHIEDAGVGSWVVCGRENSATQAIAIREV